MKNWCKAIPFRKPHRIKASQTQLDSTRLNSIRLIESFKFKRTQCLPECRCRPLCMYGMYVCMDVCVCEWLCADSSFNRTEYDKYMHKYMKWSGFVYLYFCVLVLVFGRPLQSMSISIYKRHLHSITFANYENENCIMVWFGSFKEPLSLLDSFQQQMCSSLIPFSRAQIDSKESGFYRMSSLPSKSLIFKAALVSTTSLWNIVLLICHLNYIISKIDSLATLSWNPQLCAHSSSDAQICINNQKAHYYLKLQLIDSIPGKGFLLIRHLKIS